MPSSKPPSLSLDLPPGIASLDRLIELLNDRLRRVAEHLDGPIEIIENLDMRGFRITNLGAAQALGDAVNLATGDRRYRMRDEAITEGPGVGSVSVTQVSAKRSLLLSVAGILSIRSNAAPLAMLQETKSAAQVVAVVKQAPIGADLRARLNVGGAAWADVTIAAGQTQGTRDGTGLSAITAGALVTVDVLAVGTTFPGEDLTVAVHFA